LQIYIAIDTDLNYSLNCRDRCRYIFSYNCECNHVYNISDIDGSDAAAVDKSDDKSLRSLQY